MIIDGSNVMRVGRREAKFSLLQLAIRYCLQEKYEKIHVLCDANLRHKITDPEERNMFETMLQNTTEKIHIQQSPATTVADKFILLLAVDYDRAGHEVRIMTNDMFRDFRNPAGENYKRDFEKLLAKDNILLKFMFMEDANGMSFYEYDE